MQIFKAMSTRHVTVLIVTGIVLIVGASIFFQTSSLFKVRYILVDGGAHLGETIAYFEKSKIYSNHPWEMFSFEANPNLIDRIPQKPNLTIINKAIWINDDGVDFYIGIDTSSSSIMKHKNTGDISKVPTKVESVDFGQWLKRNFKRQDFILVKLDIEGAEYAVLEKMLGDGTIKYVDVLFAEFHNVDVGVPIERDMVILKAIDELGIPTKVNPVQREDGDWFDN